MVDNGEHAMTTKHTPGPWSVGPAIEYGNGRSLVGVVQTVRMPGACHAIVSSLGAGEEECKASARLIAAAPDLLAERDRLRAVNAELVAALKLCADFIETLPYEPSIARSTRAQDAARAAIAKAEAE